METTGQTVKATRLPEDTAQALAALVRRAGDALHEPLSGSARMINNIYTGRDPLGGAASIILGEQGAPVQVVQDALSTATWNPPETTANLFLSRLRQIVSSITPGIPTFRTKARIAGAAALSDDQNRLTRIQTDHGHLREAMRRAATIGVLSPYFGVKVTYSNAKSPYERSRYKAIEAQDCGYEPFHRRFTWHAYDIQWGDIPDDWRPEFEGQEPPHDWEVLRVTEVYHDGFRHGVRGKGCPMSIFVARPNAPKHGNEQAVATLEKGPDLGVYTATVTIPECPLVIDQFLDSAPGEDVPAAEALSWIPLMRMIVQTLVQIEREIRTMNKVNLYDKAAFKSDVIEMIRNAVPGATVYAGVDVDDTGRGVNATMRPVEQNSVLDQYLAALQTYLRLFDDVTGVSPSDRGVPTNPRKSATEAQAITEAASRRNQDRLEVMARMWTRLAQVGFKYQRKVFGDRVEVPLQNGIVRVIRVPDPETAAFGFDVDPVELGHLSNSGDIQSLMQWLTVTTNVQTAFPTGIPRMTREALRRLGNAMGIEDADLYLDAPTIEIGPEERYIRHLQTQEPIQVFQDDQHDLFLAYYQRMLTVAQGSDMDENSLMALRQAMDLHSLYAARRQEVIRPASAGQVVPGIGIGPGEVDNTMAAALANGGVPDAVPQGGLDARFS